MSLDVNISEPDEFNCAELHEVIKDIAEVKNISEFEYHVDFFTDKGDNYVANLFRLVMKDISDPEQKVFKFIVKTLINSTRQELFHELHKREVFVYREVIPEFRKALTKFYEDKNFDLAKCYLSCADKGKDVIVFEDLEERGFQMDLKKYESVDYAHAHLVFRKLAKLHSLSFIIQNQDVATYDRLVSNCKDIIFDDIFLVRSKIKDFFIESFHTSTKVVINDEIRSKLLKKVSPNLIDRLKSYVEPRKCNVLCHGDFWINNILFKYENGKPVDSLFLDFQAMRYACPVTDIMYFTYLCTDVDFRAIHLNELLNVYYGTLRDVLASCNLDINEIYPRQEYEEDIEHYTNFGLLCALIELKVLTVNPEDEYHFKELKIGQDIDNVIGELRLYALRVNQIVNEFSEKGYIDKL